MIAGNDRIWQSENILSVRMLKHSHQKRLSPELEENSVENILSV